LSPCWPTPRATIFPYTTLFRSGLEPLGERTEGVRVESLAGDKRLERPGLFLERGDPADQRVDPCLEAARLLGASVHLVQEGEDPAGVLGVLVVLASFEDAANEDPRPVRAMIGAVRDC